MAKTVKAKTKTTTAAKKVVKKPSTVTKKVVAKKKTKPVVVTQAPFMQPRVTHETLYWVIFGAVAILFAMWIYTLDGRIRDLYDQIDVNTYSTDAALDTQMQKQTTNTEVNTEAKTE